MIRQKPFNVSLVHSKARFCTKKVQIKLLGYQQCQKQKGLLSFKVAQNQIETNNATSDSSQDGIEAAKKQLENSQQEVQKFATQVDNTENQLNKSLEQVEQNSQQSQEKTSQETKPQESAPQEASEQKENLDYIEFNFQDSTKPEPSSEGQTSKQVDLNQVDQVQDEINDTATQDFQQSLDKKSDETEQIQEEINENATQDFQQTLENKSDESKLIQKEINNTATEDFQQTLEKKSDESELIQEAISNTATQDSQQTLEKQSIEGEKIQEEINYTATQDFQQTLEEKSDESQAPTQNEAQSQPATNAPGPDTSAVESAEAGQTQGEATVFDDLNQEAQRGFQSQTDKENVDRKEGTPAFQKLETVAISEEDQKEQEQQRLLRRQKERERRKRVKDKKRSLKMQQESKKTQDKSPKEERIPKPDRQVVQPKQQGTLETFSSQLVSFKVLPAFHEFIKTEVKQPQFQEKISKAPAVYVEPIFKAIGYYNISNRVANKPHDERTVYRQHVIDIIKELQPLVQPSLQYLPLKALNKILYVYSDLNEVPFEKVKDIMGLLEGTLVQIFNILQVTSNVKEFSEIAETAYCCSRLNVRIKISKSYVNSISNVARAFFSSLRPDDKNLILLYFHGLSLNAVSRHPPLKESADFVETFMSRNHKDLDLWQVVMLLTSYARFKRVFGSQFQFELNAESKKAYLDVLSRKFVGISRGYTINEVYRLVWALRALDFTIKKDSNLDNAIKSKIDQLSDNINPVEQQALKDNYEQLFQEKKTPQLPYRSFDGQSTYLETQIMHLG